LQDSSDLLRQLNQNLAAVTALLADTPNEVGQAVHDLNIAAGNLHDFLVDNTDAVGTASDKAASISKAVIDSLDDIKQALHVAPTAFQNFANIFQPAQAALTGALVVNNFANPITFLCGAIQAASRLGAEQSAKLCVQYLAPIIKNRQYNFPPIGENFFVGASARPNEVTYSEDWMRPDYVPPAAPPPPDAPLPAEAPPQAAEAPPPADAAAVQANATVSTNPAAGLPGMMVPPGGGS
jgi:phospholipid/cholesterol/gamma-HCH transport system substrate-binding protein